MKAIVPDLSNESQYIAYFVVNESHFMLYI